MRLRIPFLHRWVPYVWLTSFGGVTFHVRKCAWCRRVELYAWGNWGKLEEDSYIAYRAVRA
jgi:hypothetical protein